MNKYSKIAIDVVILPPDDIMKKIIAINEQAATIGSIWGPLGRNDFFPHLSLAMGCIEYDNLKTIKNVVETVVSKFKPILVELYEVYYAETSNGAKIYCLKAKNVPELQRLHENLVNELQQRFSYECTKEFLFSKPGEKVAKPDYINKFHSLYSFKAFDPHITLRIKEETKKDVLPMSFVAKEIVACHAGTVMTCRKKLFSVKMKG